MNMRTSVDIDLIVYSFVQKLQDRGRLGTFVSVEINFDDPAEVIIDQIMDAIEQSERFREKTIIQ